MQESREASITRIDIPSTVTRIGGYAFYGCKELKEVHSNIKEPFAINENVFQNYDNGSYKFTSATLFVPAGTKSKYQATDGWKNFTNIVEMGDLPQGVVNGDGKVDVADIATIIDIMAGKGRLACQADVYKGSTS